MSQATFKIWRTPSGGGEGTYQTFQTEISDGMNHNSAAKDIWIDGKAIYSYLPWVLLGKGGGAFGGNRIARIDGEDHRNILCAVAEGMGVTIPTIGGLNVSTPAAVKA